MPILVTRDMFESLLDVVVVWSVGVVPVAESSAHLISVVARALTVLLEIAAGPDHRLSGVPQLVSARRDQVMPLDHAFHVFRHDPVMARQGPPLRRQREYLP